MKVSFLSKILLHIWFLTNSSRSDFLDNPVFINLPKGHPKYWPDVIDIGINNQSLKLSRETLLLPQLNYECIFSSRDPQILLTADFCHGVEGFLIANKVLYSIRPLLSQKENYKQVPHYVKFLNTTNWGGFKDIIDSTRLKRSIALKTIEIETAVFVDNDLLRYMQTIFPIDTERHLLKFVLAMLNAVHLLYHDSSLGIRVNFVLKRLEILQSEPRGLHRSSNIDLYLTSFCQWQEQQNRESNDHWDHALMLTGLDLYVISKTQRFSNQVVGLAPVGGMCLPRKSCTVNEGRHFESVFVVAHEIGHNLGMRHDGPSADNNCDPVEHIMAPTLATGRSSWSFCSRNYLLEFLKTPQAQCLFESSGSQLDHTSGGLLPGERFDSDMQCRLRYGSGSVHLSDDEDDICKDLRCTNERFTWSSYPALEGTICSIGKWCRKGKCVPKDTSMRLTAPKDGGWSPWEIISPCASPCFSEPESIGITVSWRACNNPRPENGGKDCKGVDRKYDTCNAVQCNKVPASTVAEFAEGICKRAKDVDASLTGTGKQKLTADKKESCTIWCDTRDGGTKSRGWIFPDGTACGTTNQERHFCISGKCEEFRCGTHNRAFVASSDICFEKIVYSRWTPVGPCHSNCIQNGKGLRVLKRGPELNIQLCDNEKACGKKRTIFDYANKICRRYGERVDKLSGLGVQLVQSLEKPDRSCHVACQDLEVASRFYLVTGEDGWFPFGTECGRGFTPNRAFCVSGKCLEFGDDDLPRLQGEFIFPNIKRKRRSLEYGNFSVATRLDKEAVRKIIESLHFGKASTHDSTFVSTFTLDLENPINVDNMWLSSLTSNSPFL